MKILIADDDHDCLRVLHFITKQAGYEPVLTKNGVEAWEILQQKDFPKLAIIDWMMPEMSGIELCRKLRATEENARIYVIMLTAKTEKKDMITALDSGADDYMTKPFDKDELVARLRVSERRMGLQQELLQHDESLRKACAETEQLLASISSILIGVDAENRITRWNDAAATVFGMQAEKVVGRPFVECGIQWDWNTILKNFSRCQDDGRSRRLDEIRFTRPDGNEGCIGIMINPVFIDATENTGFLLLASDITERKTLERQLVQSQKLESIGQLAAGVAHEINTPTQFVGDNTHFLQDSFGDLQRLLTKYRRLLDAAKNGDIPNDMVSEVDTIVEEIELDYLCEEIPRAIEQSLEGIERVTTIVRAMKAFAHPDGEQKLPNDLNKCIETAMTVSRNEWKYIADMVTDLDPDLPLVPCLMGEFSQVILNLIVNAAHAISKVNGDANGEKGTITVATQKIKDYAEVRISDTGTGIPKNARDRIFDPFFTTKEIGKGTGQGLSIAHSVVVRKHGGTIQFDTEIGQGTTFIIRLPLMDKQN